VSAVVGSGDCGGTQTDRQTDRQTEGQTETETETEENMCSCEGRACAAGRSF
jgi:hypothetical protein